MKGALAFALGAIAVAAAVIAGFSYWSDRGPTDALTSGEAEWIRQYYAWEESGRSCAAIPVADSAPMRRIERLARAACRGDITWARVEDAIHARLFFSRPLPRTTDVVRTSHIDPRIGDVAARLAKRRVEARCWSEDDWTRVNAEFFSIDPETHYWSVGRAEPGGRIHLDGELCLTLGRFFGSSYTPSRNVDRADLAEALIVFAHEAEHERDFSHSEAEVECYAVQDVRDLVRDQGRSAPFAGEIAAYAWDVSYIRADPTYTTERCHNGGPLDRNPRRAAWP